MEQPPNKCLLIGLTGGIGSGKSECARYFEEFGAKVYSADTVAKEIIDADKHIQKNIRDAFGDNVFLENGSLNRKALAEIVFANDEKLKLLDSIVHPAVIEKLGRVTAEDIDSGKYPMVVVEAALIYEAAIDENFDYIIVVTADEEEAIKRIMQRNKLQREDVVKRMESQMPVKMKVDLADFVIHNTGTLDALKERCRFMFNLLKSMAK